MVKGLKIDPSTRAYVIWKGMLQRCSNPKGDGFEYYGGREMAKQAVWASRQTVYR
jgi:hypothetical protein